jgi:bisanhydrobacterioruberin hydratase
MREKSLTVLFVAYAVLWIGGVGSYALYGGPAATENWTAAAFLWVAGLITLFSSGRSFSLFLVLASAAALAIEILGVATGKVFGAYEYTEALGFRLLDAPIVIAMAWCIFLGYVWHGTSYLRYGVLVRAAVGALWMMCLDLLVDPLAAGPLAYWRWSEGGWYEGIPLSNFAGWFVVSFVLLLFLHQRRLKNSVARAIGLSVLMFFTVLAGLRGMIIPAFVGIALMAVDILLLPREREGMLRSLRPFFWHKRVGRGQSSTDRNPVRPFRESDR